MHHVVLRRRWQYREQWYRSGVYVVPEDMPYNIAARAINEGHAVLLDDYEDEWRKRSPEDKAIHAAPENKSIH